MASCLNNERFIECVLQLYRARVEGGRRGSASSTCCKYRVPHALHGGHDGGVTSEVEAVGSSQEPAPP